jgi:erythromycin esterase-like protein
MSDIRAAAIPMRAAAAELPRLVKPMTSGAIVLIGEASHGTQEFYRERVELTRHLISEHGFNFVAVEADWPDAYRVNRFVKGESDDRDAAEALSDFKRFPGWMWRNTEVASFVEWLRQYNRHTSQLKTGFYGLDLYSLYSSIGAVIGYLDGVDPALAGAARERYGCFEELDQDAQRYGHAVTYGGLEACEEQAVQQLLDMQRHSLARLVAETAGSQDEAFFAEQNARVVKNAERYYRVMYRSDVESWNLRDRHMAETMDALLLHDQRLTPRPRAVIWAHNSHIGDARATSMSARGELNIGQLIKQRYGPDAFALGSTTYTGSVTAARNWGDDAEQRHVRPALPGSFEALFHDAAGKKSLLLSQDLPALERLERAIGVIYRPETERWSHYFDARIASQFDAVVHIDETHALQPLEVTDLWRAAEPSELPAASEETLRA